VLSVKLLQKEDSMYGTVDVQ